MSRKCHTFAITVVGLAVGTGLALVLGFSPVNPILGQPGRPAPSTTADKSAPVGGPSAPEAELKAFEIAAGFRIELAAAEPLVQSPIAAEFDEQGRMWVIELPEYNAYAVPGSQEKGRIVCLEDTDGNGRFDRRTVFLDGVKYPTGIYPWDGGLFVGAAPDLLYCKDTNGDGKADDRRVVLTGFGTDKAGEAQLNSFRWTFDNRLFIFTGMDGGNIRRPDQPESESIGVRNLSLLLDPRTGRFETTSGGGQHGFTIDSQGNRFVSGNSDPIHHLTYDARYLSTAPHVIAGAAARNILPSGKFTKLNRISPVESWRELRTRLRKEGKVPGSDEGGSPSGFFTGATGITAYRGGLFPGEFHDNLFVGEVANNLVFRARTRPQGSGLLAERVDDKREFLACRDTWFRPVQFSIGPEGALYVIDMYRELIEGAAFLPPEVLKTVDVTAGIKHGRIWRIVPECYRPAPLKLPAESTTKELVASLESPNGWTRDTAARLLDTRRDPTATEHLTNLLASGKREQAIVHGMWLLADSKQLTGKQLIACLRHSSYLVRREAIRAAERSPKRADVLEALHELRRDPDPGVRIQLAYSLNRVDETRASTIVYVQLLIRDMADPAMQQACLVGVPRRSRGFFLEQVVESLEVRRSVAGRQFVSAMAELIGADPQEGHIPQLFAAMSSVASKDPDMGRLILRGLLARPAPETRTVLGDVNFSKGVEAIISRLTNDAVLTVRDSRKSPESRSAAIRDLRMLPNSQSIPLLKECLGATQPPAVQVAALETLGKLSDDQIPSIILGQWKSYSPAVRATAVEVWLSRNNWVQHFLDAVEEKKIARGDIDPARIALLKRSPMRAIAVRTAKLFDSASTGREKVVEEYRRALKLSGSADKGKIVFKGQCSACHQLDGVGENIGADLKAIRDRGTEGMLLNILDPNREVKPQFMTYACETKSGRLVTGMITSESATAVTIRKADGRSETISRAEIDSLRSLGISYMPEGLEKEINPQAMADLLAYLNSIK